MWTVEILNHANSFYPWEIVCRVDGEAWHICNTVVSEDVLVAVDLAIEDVSKRDWDTSDVESIIHLCALLERHIYELTL